MMRTNLRTIGYVSHHSMYIKVKKLYYLQNILQSFSGILLYLRVFWDFGYCVLNQILCWYKLNTNLVEEAVIELSVPIRAFFELRKKLLPLDRMYQLSFKRA